MKLKSFLKEKLPLVGILIFLIALGILFNAINDRSFKKSAASSAEAGGQWLLEYREPLEDAGIPTVTVGIVFFI